MKTITAFACLLLLLVSSQFATADTFGVLDPFDIEFVTVGNPGNANDTTGDPNPVGKVDYRYRIGKFEISEDMIDKANAQSLADGDPLGITQSNRGANKPATYISWFEAAQFVNWLNIDSGSTPAYKFDSGGDFQLWQPTDAGYDSANVFRNSLAKYFLPSTDEWYKSAYYDPSGSGTYYDFPTGSNTAPAPVASGTAPGSAVYDDQLDPADITLAGGMSAYGTVGQGGNVLEWEESEFDLVNDSVSADRGLRGGAWSDGSTFLAASNRDIGDSPTLEFRGSGFRVASTSVPEPSSAMLGVLTTVGLVLRRRR